MNRLKSIAAAAGLALIALAAPAAQAGVSPGASFTRAVFAEAPIAAEEVKWGHGGRHFRGGRHFGGGRHFRGGRHFGGRSFGGHRRSFKHSRGHGRYGHGGVKKGKAFFGKGGLFFSKKVFIK